MFKYTETHHGWCTPEFIEDAVRRFYRRAEAARAAGGIARKDIEEGVPAPEGWVWDPQIDYLLPPNVKLL